MKKLTIKQLTNIALLIAISVGLVYFGILLMGLSSIPNLRAAFAGIPVKMAGFIYGPIVGIVTGAISDVLGLIVFPTFYHPGYTLDLMISGLIPGIIGLMYRGHKLGDTSLTIIGNVIMGIVAGIFLTLRLTADDIGISGQVKFAMSIYLFQMVVSFILFNLAYFILKSRDSKYVSILWLLIMSVFLTDNVVIFFVPYWDYHTLGIDYVTGLSLSMLYFGIKMWFNVTLLFIVFSILDKQILKQAEYQKHEDLTSIKNTSRVKKIRNK